MKRFRSQKKVVMHSQKTLKKRKMVKSPLETEASTSGHEVKEEDIVDECKPAASATLREEKRTTMIKIVNALDPLCSIYEVNFKHLAEENKLGVKEGLRWKVKFVLIEPLYKVRRYKKMIMRSRMYSLQTI